MKTAKIASRVALVAAAVMMVGGYSFAAGNGDGKGQGAGKGNRGNSARAQMRSEQKSAAKEHFTKQKEENKAFREGLRENGTTPSAAAAASKEHCETQYGENVEFRSSQHEKCVEMAKKQFAKKEIPEDQQSEILSRIEERYTARNEYSATQHAENVALFEELSKNENLTAEEFQNAVKEHFKTQREENREERQSHRQERQGNRQGRRKGQGGIATDTGDAVTTDE